MLRVPDPLIDQNPDWTGFWDFGAPWNPGNDNPWVDGTLMAPFDQEVMHFICGFQRFFLCDCQNVFFWL